MLSKKVMSFGVSAFNGNKKIPFMMQHLLADRMGANKRETIDRESKSHTVQTQREAVAVELLIVEDEIKGEKIRTPIAW